MRYVLAESGWASSINGVEATRRRPHLPSVLYVAMTNLKAKTEPWSRQLIGQIISISTELAAERMVVFSALPPKLHAPRPRAQDYLNFAISHAKKPSQPTNAQRAVIRFGHANASFLLQ
ncbi:hypothetical protein G7046_g5118 [Stylonectria norvegica]|nr:hypothetical protein G7046_g5118 [Stylonectria norvegica]